MSAEWRPIPEWPNYEASSDGHVRSWRVRGFGLGRRAAEPRVFAPWPQAGYRRVHLCAGGGRRRSCAVGPLALAAFAGPRPAGHEARRLNRLKTDDRLSNLAWRPRERRRRREAVASA
jgi:hypothetical protein